MIEAHEAQVNITYARQNANLPDPVAFDATNEQILQWVAEAIRGGGVPGLPADPNPDLEGYTVERCEPIEGRPFNLLMVRPKTPYGAR